MILQKIEYDLERFVDRASCADALDLVNFLERIVARKLLNKRNDNNAGKYGFYYDDTPDWDEED